MSTVSTVNGGISFWYAQEGTPTPREPLPGDTTADICIIGGGYTGLWTAYYLKKAVPFLNITVLEAKSCGYGASGRNGGWLYNGIAGRDRYAELHGHDAAVRLQQAMNDTVGEVIRTAADEHIDADIHHGGVLEIARTPAQLARLKDFHSIEIAFGQTDRVLRGARETSRRIHVTGAVGSTWPATIQALRDLLTGFFPTTAGARIDDAWSGVLGVPRDWCATVTLDRSTGLGWAGGYVGSGVATANLAARTLRDLIQQDSGQAGPTDLTTLPWVNHKVRRWEPEPLRWLGVHSMYAAYRTADRRETTSPHPGTDRIAKLADRIAGRH